MNRTHRIEHAGRTFFVTVGVDDRGRPLEVFGSSSKITSDLDFHVRDACIVVSIALQHGATPAEIDHSLNKVPVPGIPAGEQPASLLGRIVAVLDEHDAR